MVDTHQQLPSLIRVGQSLPRPVVESVEDTVHQQLSQLDLSQRIHSGDTIAITVGSRGIANIDLITRGIARFLSSIGGRPFLVPAMGSHGGATADGQRRVLERLGITEAFCECPIRSGLDTEVIGRAPQGFEIHVDRRALEADHIVVCNRVKAHTSIRGELESGLVKMLLVGLGNATGARLLHQALANHSFADIAADTVPQVIRRCKIIAGIGIVENAYDDTAIIEAFAPNEIVTREAELLVTAKQLMARLPFDEIDVLLIDEIGKDISGTGMDTNVIGRKSNDHQAMGDERPRIKRICVRSLSEKTAGNALGIGLAEFCHSRVLDQIDRHATHLNCLTSNHPTAGMLPLDFPSDREMLSAAMSTIGLVSPEHCRFVWIKNTLRLTEFVCSAAMINRDDLEIRASLGKPAFDSDGNLSQSPIGS